MPHPMPNANKGWSVSRQLESCPSELCALGEALPLDSLSLLSLESCQARVLGPFHMGGPPWGCTVDNLCSCTGHPCPQALQDLPSIPLLVILLPNRDKQVKKNPRFLWCQGQDNETTFTYERRSRLLPGHTHSARRCSSQTELTSGFHSPTLCFGSAGMRPRRPELPATHRPRAAFRQDCKGTGGEGPEACFRDLLGLCALPQASPPLVPTAPLPECMVWLCSNRVRQQNKQKRTGSWIL